jgi:hypothetical protein
MTGHRRTRRRDFTGLTWVRSLHQASHVVEEAKHRHHGLVTKRRDGKGPGKGFFAILLGLAGLGVGVWLFRARRKKPH